jgi:dynamin family protein
MTTQPSAVLDQFNHLRRQILEVLDEARELGTSLGPMQARIAPVFATARQAVDLSRLNLMVIGAEGHGKSTLINSIMGEDLTPREQQHPGTVAPVFLEWSPSRQPVFSVTIDGRAEPVICRDAGEFSRYLLQKSNPGNEEKVLQGTISYDHPALAKGLRLVDMPGVEGVSPTIAVEAQRFIKKSAHAVLAVVRDRGYGALARTLSDISGDELRVQAVVSNWSLDVWLGKPDEALGEFVRDQKRAVVTYLRQEGADARLTADHVFVLHLPSFSAAQSGGTPMVQSAVHDQESEAFVTTVWDYVRGHGLDEVILDGTEKAERALLELEGLLDIRRSVLQALIEGGEGTGAELADQFERAADSAANAWQEVFNDQVIDAMAEQQWGPVKADLDVFRDRMLETIHDIQAQVNAREGRIRRAEAATIRAELQRRMAAELARSEETQGRILQEVAEYYCGHANAVLERLFEDVPVIRETVGMVPLTTQGLLDFELSSMEPGLKDKLLKAGAVSMASLISGSLAGGGGAFAWLAAATALGPVSAAIVGGIGGGLLVWGLVNLLRDEHRPAVLKGLEQCKAEVQALDTSRSGKLRGAWSEAVATVARGVDAYLAARIGNIRQMITDPGGSRDQVDEQRQEIETAIEAVHGLMARLTAIGARGGR